MRPAATRSELLDAYRNAGELFATVYLPARSAVEDAEQRFALRSKNALRLLREAGADDELMTAIGRAMDRHDHDDGQALVLVASASAVHVDYPTIRPVSQTFTALERTPTLLPLLAATQSDIDHVAVLIDRTGAEVWARTGVADPIETRTVSGDTEHVHRGHPGGWSQRRFQQRAENTWESNAALVADEVDDVLDRPGLVVVGGDVRAVGFLVGHLHSRHEVLEVDGSRSADHDAFLDHADAAVRDVAAQRLADDIQHVLDAIAEGRGATGSEVLDLASQGRVARLYVIDDSLSRSRPEAGFDFSVPMHQPDLDAGHVTAPVTDGAVALGVATGAEIVVLPESGLPGIDTLAATLRG